MHEFSRCDFDHIEEARFFNLPHTGQNRVTHFLAGELELQAQRPESWSLRREGDGHDCFQMRIVF